MDAVSNIKARLPIEELVGRYCTLQKKGRNFVCLCPFHNDSRPSLLVSPDKGIAYCFACQTGGDIFSFYQAIEGVTFQEALKELAERTGVQLETQHAPLVHKDEKERLRQCLHSALAFFQSQLMASESSRNYLRGRGVTSEQEGVFELGFAPDSFSQTYEHLLKVGFSRKEILAAGLGVQRELSEEKIYDRFRNRLIFPIHDSQGGLIGFGGRTLGQDDAKYVNSPDGPLYHKGSVLYGLSHARDPMREAKHVILVEGYFDVLACHKVKVQNVVATCGTALTSEHVKVLRRYVSTVTLCLDQDRAGREAMSRAFQVLAPSGVQVNVVVLPGKDPGDLVVSDPEELGRLLRGASEPYIGFVIDRMGALDLSNASLKREALRRLLALLRAVPSAVERADYLQRAARALGTTETALEADLALAHVPPPPAHERSAATTATKQEFSATEIALGIFLFYPSLRHLLSQLMMPEDGFASALYTALSVLPDIAHVRLEELDIPPEYRERVSLLHMFCEYHGFTEWSESMAAREIRKNCEASNRELLRQKQLAITARLLEARKAGRFDDEATLLAQYSEMIKQMHKVS